MKSTVSPPFPSLWLNVHYNFVVLATAPGVGTVVSPSTSKHFHALGMYSARWQWKGNFVPLDMNKQIKLESTHEVVA